MNRCPDCGLDIDLVGQRHRCVPRQLAAHKPKPKSPGGAKKPQARGNGQFDRVAYQREYMRKRRAALRQRNSQGTDREQKGNVG